MNSHESAEQLVSAQNMITGWREKARAIMQNLPTEYRTVYDKNEDQYISFLLEAALATDKAVANGSAVADGLKENYADFTDSYLPDQVVTFKAKVIAEDVLTESIPLFYVARIIIGEVALRQEQECRRQKEEQHLREKVREIDKKLKPIEDEIAVLRTKIDSNSRALNMARGKAYKPGCGTVLSLIGGAICIICLVVVLPNTPIRTTQDVVWVLVLVILAILSFIPLIISGVRNSDVSSLESDMASDRENLNSLNRKREDLINKRKRQI